MAGDWIPMRMELPDDPAVVSIAADTKLSEDAVVGKLLRLWSWANTHTTDGKSPGITSRWVDRYVGKTGFGAAMEKAGWIVFDAAGVMIVKFERYNGKGAKQRLESNRRVAEHRQRKLERNMNGVTDALPKPLPEKRREEKRRTPSGTDGVADPPPPASESNPPPLCGAERIIREWVGNRLSASDRDKLARAERQRGEADFVVIHDIPQPATTLFERAIVEAIASSRDGGFRAMGPFLRLVGSIEARCARDGVWPGEGLERANGHHEPTTDELLAADKARRAK